MAEPRPRDGDTEKRAGLGSLRGLAGGDDSAGLDPLIHGRIRLGIVSALAVQEKVGFAELRDLLETSDGNLSTHAAKLEDAGYVAIEKSFRGKVPHTEYRLTATGRKALDRYLSHLEGIIRVARGGEG